MRTYERGWWWVKEKKQVALVFIAITMILQFQMKDCAGCLETEKMGLLQLKSYLNSFLILGKESILESWSHDASNNDCCLWERVNCSDAIGGHIVHLSLDGIMPFRYVVVDMNPPPLPLNLSLLHSFPQLQSLDFSYNGFNHLFDPIHGYKSFHRLEKLRTLNFYENRLNNSILLFLSAARSLTTLNLGHNKLEGVFPPNELANMTKLRVLNLKFNDYNLFSVQGLLNFTELEVLNLERNNIKDFEAGDGLRTTKLKILYLMDNSFSDTAQLRGLQHLVELQVLNLAYNRFNHTGPIQILKDMPKLEQLDLSWNGFTKLDSLGLVFPSSLQVLDLRHNQLSSTPKGYSEICKLTHLQELGLSNNRLTNMPYCLGNLSRLRTLDLSENQLNGNLSFFVSGLPSKLEYLALDDNNFNGSFRFNSLLNHTSLMVFKLSSKVATIQDVTESSWVPLFQLKLLKLQNFIFGRKTPGFLLHQHDLCIIDLSHNELAGAFPSWLVQNNTKLLKLLLNRNSLRKFHLPKLVHDLQALDISSNMISDSIQEDIGIVFPKLRYMNFSSNDFHGIIPSSMGEMESLEMLDVSYNNLSKAFFSSCYSLKFLKLSKNQFNGEIFPEHANLTSLEMLFLDGNNLTGSLGKGILNSKSLSCLDISENSFSGTVPLWIGRMSSLNYLYMRGNHLKGAFPHQLQNLHQLEVIDMSHNSFSGSIPRNLDFPSLKDLRLQSNNFIGSIPDALFNVEELQVLDLRNNNFSGNILKTIGKTSKLHVLLLRNNNFQTHIPEKICQLSKISLLDLSHNKFKGDIPSCLGNMSFGAEKYDSHFPFNDGFEYTIVQLLQNWSYTSVLNSNDADLDFYFQPAPTTIVEFLTKSRYEAYQGDILQYMYGLDCSNNQLSGEIPDGIGNLHNIIALDFSSNRLTGSIPDSISKMKDLESLDLSNNKLYGNIPSQLADLNSLGYFNVSHNNLFGEIPFKGHLTFDERSYIGNCNLCGLPTNKSCNPKNTESSAPKHAKEEEKEECDGVIDMVWFHWTCGAVYISTFLALFVFLSIDSRWSQEWFYRVDLFVHYLQCFKGHFIN